jgi:large subunit ribosomal protein L19e
MNTVRRISAEILGVGESKVRFKPDALQKIGEALTRDDVRSLVKSGDIFAVSPRGVSRLRGRGKQEQKRKGRRGSHGSRKGTPGARKSLKESWIAKVRLQRTYLASLVQGGKISRKDARKAYMMAKGNAFKGVNILETYLKDNKLVK